MPIPPSLCDHCGNETYKSSHGDFLGGGNRDEEFIMYNLQRCQICNMPLLMKYVFNNLRDYRRYSNTEYLDFKDSSQLWPPPLSLPSEAPERVRLIYEEARLVHRSPSSFVVQIGRALEAITKDFRAEGNTLNNKLNWLIEKGHLPQQLGQMGHISRILRNWAAHDAEIDVQPDDVEIIDEFFKAIVEYLYEAPAKIDRVQALLSERTNPTDDV